MTEPLSTLTAAAIATLIATKAFEKIGEKISEQAWALTDKLLRALKRKHASTASAIEQVAKTPDLAEQQPHTYGAAALIAQVEEASQQDWKVRQAVQAIEQAVRAQSGAVVNLTQLAEKIGVVNQGKIMNQTNTLSF